ncbi:MAG: M43 family zinc metalloprotease [Chitinophagales bacterium]
MPAANLDEFGRVKIANLNISFCLATTDEHGNTMAEPGIERINYLDKGWPAPTNYTTQATFKNYLDNILKPSSIWDVTKYMNIWITDKSPALTNGGVSSVPPLSGIADIPNSATDSTDGIWCYAKMTGSYPLFPSGTYLSSNIDGRTLTHEAGHYF